jgi:hypothetical protein
MQTAIVHANGVEPLDGQEIASLERFRLSRASDAGSAKHAFELRYCAYRAVDAIPEIPSKSFTDEYNNQANIHCYVLYREELPIGSIRACITSGTYNIKQARDADNHSIQDITAFQAGSRAMRFVNPRGGHIKRMQISGGQIVHYEGDPMIVEDHPPHPIAVRVKNHGEWFNPPSTHLGHPVPNQHPVLLAELAHKFYSSYIDEVDRKFFDSSPQ